MKNYALIETATSIVTNVIVWDGKTPWRPPDGFIAVAIPSDQGVCIGWSYIDGVFVPPSQLEVSTTQEDTPTSEDTSIL